MNHFGSLQAGFTILRATFDDLRAAFTILRAIFNELRATYRIYHRKTPAKLAGVFYYFSLNCNDAPTNSRNNGCGRFGLEINSGWN